MKAAHAILLVEDNPADIKITQRALRDSPTAVELIVARDGPDALEMAVQMLRQLQSADDSPFREVARA